MANELAKAREYAERVRFSGDTLRSGIEGETGTIRQLTAFLSHTGIRISPALTPSLFERLERVFERLSLPERAIDAFVYASPDLQAECFASGMSECIIRFSSSLVELLDEEEFEFVAGHELGHFLLGHGIARSETDNESVEILMKQRGQEISVDRVGLLACHSLDTAIRALMKTASGLTDRHLRFDVGAFVSQLRKGQESISQGSFATTHPSIVVRCRALLWFSLNEFYKRGADFFSEEEMARLDGLVEKDLLKFVDGPARQIMEEAKESLAIWMAAHEIVQDGVFNKNEQQAVREMFGLDILERLKNFLVGIPKNEIQDAVYERMQTARQELENVMPSSSAAEIEKIQDKIRSGFKGA